MGTFLLIKIGNALCVHKMLLLSAGCLLISFLHSLTEANSAHLPRMIFTDKEITIKRVPLPGHDVPVWILLEDQPDNVTVIGQTTVTSYNFQNPEKTLLERKVLWKQCINSSPQEDCSYNITVVHKMKKASQVFVCGTNDRETVCCDMNLSDDPPKCSPRMGDIQNSISRFVIKEGEPSALMESAESADLYITRSGSQSHVGIHKFGKNRVGPSDHNKEQHYVGLIFSRRTNDSSQDKVYAFYKERNNDPGLYSGMWLPFVTQVCMADIGGPKNQLQFKWTSQMYTRLFCGDTKSKQHFSELVDVATVHADRWQDTRVYALFRNEWGMSAVCVYIIQDIDHVFTTSPLKSDGTDKTKKRPRTCIKDSTLTPSEALRITSEMEQWVQPMNNSGPLLFNHHNYTHIYVDSSQYKQNYHHIVLFLSLNNGAIHKMMQNKTQAFIITEYRPFNHHTHILSMTLHPSSRKLYVNSRSELVQLDVTNCVQYGHSCEDCVLASDPYCGWNGTHCIPETHGTLHNVATRTCSISPNLEAFRYPTDTYADKDVDSITLPSESKYFLQCPMSSHHAQYTWYHHENSISCSLKEHNCLLLINSMGPEQEGIYKCVSEEMGYTKVLAVYRLALSNKTASRSSRPLVWVWLLAVLIKHLSC
uniref:Sema domain-containing protein n=1 Tax=Monopterus albus TaxID=43700 RepID=A0A3Q3IB99_MONAL|nr:semaphorin-7A-like [Monopterus albus]